MKTIATLPESTRTASQVKTFANVYSENGTMYSAELKLRYDDECRNGHNTFSATVWAKEKADNGRWVDSYGGAAHEEIARVFPEYSKYLKWHLVSSDGPMHYIANTVYHANDKDYRGLRAGEKRQLKNGKTGLPTWHYVAIHKETGEETRLHDIGGFLHDDNEKPACEYTLDVRPVWLIGEGKPRDLDAARSCAVWPDATDEELTAPGLEERLAERLPALMEEFKRDMEELGFTY